MKGLDLTSLYTTIGRLLGRYIDPALHAAQGRINVKFQ